MMTEVVTRNDHANSSQVHELLVPVSGQIAQLIWWKLEFALLDQFSVSLDVLFDAIVHMIWLLFIEEDVGFLGEDVIQVDNSDMLILNGYVLAALKQYRFVLIATLSP